MPNPDRYFDGPSTNPPSMGRNCVWRSIDQTASSAIMLPSSLTAVWPENDNLRRDASGSGPKLKPSKEGPICATSFPADHYGIAVCD